MNKQKSKSNLGPVRRAPAQQRRTRRARLAPYPANGIGSSTGLMRPQATPQGVSVGVVIPQSMFKFDGKAQQLADIGGMGDNCRVCGTDLFTLPIKAGSSTAAAGFGGTATYWANCGPGDISTRLTNLEEMFQFYAIRELQVMYTPEVATSKSVSLALGVAQDFNELTSDITAPTQQQLVEMTPAMKIPAYQPASIVYRHTGMRVWSTSTGGSQPYDLAIQLALGATLVGADLAEGTQYGSLWLSYVIDFYKPSPVLSSPAFLRRKADRLEARLRKAGHDNLTAQPQAEEKKTDSAPQDQRPRPEIPSSLPVSVHDKKDSEPRAAPSGVRQDDAKSGTSPAVDLSLSASVPSLASLAPSRWVLTRK